MIASLLTVACLPRISDYLCSFCQFLLLPYLQYLHVSLSLHCMVLTGGLIKCNPSGLRSLCRTVLGVHSLGDWNIRVDNSWIGAMLMACSSGTRASTFTNDGRMHQSWGQIRKRDWLFSGQVTISKCSQRPAFPSMHQCQFRSQSRSCALQVVSKRVVKPK